MGKTAQNPLLTGFGSLRSGGMGLPPSAVIDSSLYDKDEVGKWCRWLAVRATSSPEEPEVKAAFLKLYQKVFKRVWKEEGELHISLPIGDFQGMRDLLQKEVRKAEKAIWSSWDETFLRAREDFQGKGYGNIAKLIEFEVKRGKPLFKAVSPDEIPDAGSEGRPVDHLMYEQVVDRCLAEISSIKDTTDAVRDSMREMIEDRGPIPEGFDAYPHIRAMLKITDDIVKSAELDPVAFS